MLYTNGCFILYTLILDIEISQYIIIQLLQGTTRSISFTFLYVNIDLKSGITVKPKFYHRVSQVELIKMKFLATPFILYLTKTHSVFEIV